MAQKPTKENWDTYIANYENDLPGSTVLRMDLIDVAPIKDYPFVLITGLTYESSREDVFPDKTTLETLYKVEDDLIAFLNKKIKYLYVGSFTHNHERLLYFYLKSDKNLQKELENFYTSKYPKREYQIQIEEDKNWEYYTEFLYPNEATRDYMSDLAVIESLEKNGDNLQQVRKIDHWIYFSTEQDLKAFEIEVKQLGFETGDTEKVEDSEMPFQIQIWHEDKADITTINTATSKIKNLAKQHNGDYDGWECIVVKQENK
jgi:uncharacterized protein (TIGR01619 family)